MTFKSGQSGNINGRPRGIADKRTKLRELLEIHAEKLIQKMIELALEGNVIAMRLCIERLIPKLRKEPIEIELNDDNLKIKKDLLQAILDGRLGVNEAEKLLNLVKKEANKTPYKLDTVDAIEASKIYQSIMLGTYKSSGE